MLLIRTRLTEAQVTELVRWIAHGFGSYGRRIDFGYQVGNNPVGWSQLNEVERNLKLAEDPHYSVRDVCTRGRSFWISL